MSGMTDEEFERHVRFAQEYTERLSMEEIMERAQAIFEQPGAAEKALEELAKWTTVRALEPQTPPEVLR